MATRTKNIFTSVIIGLLLLTVLHFVLAVPTSDVSAAPPAAPTPIANIPSSDSSLNITFQSALSLQTSVNTSGRLVGNYEYVDVQYIAAQDAGNALTITIQYSNDNSNWVDGAVLANFASTTADRTDITRFPLFGRYVRFAQTINNANPVTITILGLAK